MKDEYSGYKQVMKELGLPLEPSPSEMCTLYPPEQLPSILEYFLHCQQGLEKICIEQCWRDTKEFERLLKIDVEVNEIRDYLKGVTDVY